MTIDHRSECKREGSGWSQPSHCLTDLNILTNELLPEKLPGLEHEGDVVEGSESLLASPLLGPFLLVVQPGRPAHRQQRSSSTIRGTNVPTIGTGILSCRKETSRSRASLSGQEKTLPILTFYHPLIKLFCGLWRKTGTLFNVHVQGKAMREDICVKE